MKKITTLPNQGTPSELLSGPYIFTPFCSNSKISTREDKVRDLARPPNQKVCLPLSLLVLGDGRPQQGLGNPRRPKAPDLRHHQRPRGHRPRREEVQEHGGLVRRATS